MAAKKSVPATTDLTQDAAAPVEVGPGIPQLHPDHVRALVEGRHPRPHDALGQHPVRVGGVDGYVIRAIRPLAESVTAVQTDGTRILMSHSAEGLWQGFAPGIGQAYQLETGYAGSPT